MQNMASKLFFFSNTTFLLFVILYIFCSLSFADVSTIRKTPVSSSTICKSTFHSSFCKSLLPKDNSSANVYDYGQFSVGKSLSSAREFLSLIQTYLRNPSSLTITAIRALKNCQLLADLNIDFLSITSKIVSSSTTILPTLQAEEALTLLSATLTNTQTCIDGLLDATSAWTSRNGLDTRLYNDTMLHSVSLTLFTKGWVPDKKKLPSPGPKKRLPIRNGTKSKPNQAISEPLNRRKLLQTGGDFVQVNGIVVVSQDGSGDFITISAAVNAAPNKTDGTTGYFLIYITAGVYQEYVSINKDQRFIMMIGDGINQTVITGNHSVAGGFATFDTPTFAVVGKGFVGVNITFRNTAGAINNQAVAVRNGADLSTFYSCSFEGYQDTLYPHSNRQFYRECDIYGTVDFIFGNGVAVFQNCNIYPRLPLQGQFNAITAQGRTDPGQNTGISIQNCTIRAANDLASSNGTTQTYLGRPWKEYSRTIYMQSFMDSLINQQGWHAWSGTFALSTLYYAEFNNTGPGSNTSGRVNWTGIQTINDTVAASFTVSYFLLGDAWLPQTGVPYTPNLG